MVRLQRYNIQEGKCKKFLKNVNENKTAESLLVINYFEFIRKVYRYSPTIVSVRFHSSSIFL